jgi:hypothetical protein
MRELLRHVPSACSCFDTCSSGIGRYVDSSLFRHGTLKTSLVQCATSALAQLHPHVFARIDSSSNLHFFHLRNIFKEDELAEESNVQNLHIANSDKPVKIYNLDVIISFGYRVNSKQCTQFRQKRCGFAPREVLDQPFCGEGWAVAVQSKECIREQPAHLDPVATDPEERETQLNHGARLPPQSVDWGTPLPVKSLPGATGLPSGRRVSLQLWLASRTTTEAHIAPRAVPAPSELILRGQRATVRLHRAWLGGCRTALRP